MRPKPIALPRPTSIEVAAVSASESAADPAKRMTELLRRRDAMAFEQELLDAEIERFAIESICGPTDDTQDVENYDGTRGVTRQFVDTHERAVGQLQWINDLAQRFSGPNNSPGDVAGVRWGTGGLISNDVFITAGHCFDADGGGWKRPSRNGVTILPDEIATLMQVNFIYQVNGTTGQVRPGEPFPVAELLEYRLGGLDFGIVRVGRNAAGRFPGEIYGVLNVAAVDLTLAGATLCMVQHPSGRPKRVDAGPLLRNVGGRVEYNTLDTEGGSSGSPILSPNGELIGVHTNGGCTRFSGANFGVAIGAIRNASSLII